jgi:hypothetical protein
MKEILDVLIADEASLMFREPPCLSGPFFEPMASLPPMCLRFMKEKLSAGLYDGVTHLLLQDFQQMVYNWRSVCGDESDYIKNLSWLGSLLNNKMLPYVDHPTFDMELEEDASSTDSDISAGFESSEETPRGSDMSPSKRTKKRCEWTEEEEEKLREVYNQFPRAWTPIAEEMGKPVWVCRSK